MLDTLNKSAASIEVPHNSDKVKSRADYECKHGHRFQRSFATSEPPETVQCYRRIRWIKRGEWWEAACEAPSKRVIPTEGRRSED